MANECTRSGPRRRRRHRPAAVRWPTAAAACELALSSAIVEKYSSSLSMKNSVADDVALERSLRDNSHAVAAASARTVPVIDLASANAADAMWEAATTVGFFTLKNHGLPQELVDAAFQNSSEFFARPRAEKDADSPFARDMNSGYEFMSQVRPSTGTADQKESLQVTAREGAMDGRWPSAPAALEPSVRALLDAGHALACRVVSLLEPRACPSLPPGTLAAAHRLWGDDGQCTLRLLHYPPTAPVDPAATGPRLWRAGPHRLVLRHAPLPAAGRGRARVRRQPAAAAAGAAPAAWAPVEPVEGGIAVNVGDMLSRWSDGRLLSNLHRVRMPLPEEAGGADGLSPSRYSIAFFLQADKRALIKSETHDEITAGDYILGRIRSNFAGGAEK